MFTFLRNMRKSLIGSDNTRKYLLYAIGEILLVMIGILLALQVNNWNQNRQNRNVEREILSDIQESLIKDIELTINPSIAGFEIRKQIAATILNAANTNGDLHDSLESQYVQMARWLTFKPIKTPYKMLESEGLKTITNRKLRSSIVDLYDNSYDQIADGILNETTNIRELYRPLMREHFVFHPRREDSTVPYVPKDVDVMLADQDFLNMLTIVLNNSSRNGYLIEHQLRPKVDLVIKAIELELKK